MKFKRTCNMFVCEGEEGVYTPHNKSFRKLLAVQRGPYSRAYYGQGCGRVWPHNSAPMPHGMRRALWKMRGEGCLLGVFNMMLIDDSFPLL